MLKRGTELYGELENLIPFGAIFSNALRGGQTNRRLRETELDYRALADFTYGCAYREYPDESSRYVSLP